MKRHLELAVALAGATLIAVLIVPVVLFAVTSAACQIAWMKLKGKA